MIRLHIRQKKPPLLHWYYQKQGRFLCLEKKGLIRYETRKNNSKPTQKEKSREIARKPSNHAGFTHVVAL